MNNTGHTVMILSVGAGSGHLRAAEAVAAVCETHPDIDRHWNLDALDYTNRLFRQFYAGSYMSLVKRSPGLWGWFYEATDEPWETDTLRKMLDYPNTGPLADLIEKEQPDVVVCTHFLPAEIVSHLIRRKRIDARLAIVVTDFHVHAMWLSRVFHRYFVANDESKVHLAMLGFPEDRVTVSGIPVHPLFSESQDVAKLRKKWGVDTGLPVVLVSAGTFGVTGAEEIVRALGFLKTPVEAVVICGRNAELREAVDQYVHSEAPRHLNFHVQGYTIDMHEWMSVADLFIGKPGGLTTAEALSKGLPMIVYQPIPGQEEYNSDYLLENGVALKCNDLTTLAYKLDGLLNDTARLSAMREKASRLAHGDAAQTIVDVLLDDLRLLPRPTPAGTLRGDPTSSAARRKAQSVIDPLIADLQRWRRTKTGSPHSSDRHEAPQRRHGGRQFAL